jgi:hypothetical protein
MRNYAMRAAFTAGLCLTGIVPLAAKDVVLTIYFSDNPEPRDPLVPALCRATTVTQSKKATLSDKITWKIKEDDDDKCPGFKSELVSIRFVRRNPTTTPNPLRPTGNQIKAEIEKENLGSSRYRYVVFYGKAQAELLAEDPELDITGDGGLIGGR